MRERHLRRRDRRRSDGDGHGARSHRARDRSNTRVPRSRDQRARFGSGLRGDTLWRHSPDRSARRVSDRENRHQRGPTRAAAGGARRGSRRRIEPTGLRSRDRVGAPRHGAGEDRNELPPGRVRRTRRLQPLPARDYLAARTRDRRHRAGTRQHRNHDGTRGVSGEPRRTADPGSLLGALSG